MKQLHSGILKDKTVALLMGGPGKERDVSLRSGAAVAKALRTAGAHLVEIDVTTPEIDVSESVNLAFNIIHRSSTREASPTRERESKVAARHLIRSFQKKLSTVPVCQLRAGKKSAVVSLQAFLCHMS